MNRLTCEERDILEILLQYKKKMNDFPMLEDVSIEKDEDGMVRITGLTQEQWRALCVQLEASRKQFIHDGILSMLKRYEHSPGQLSIVFKNSKQAFAADKNGMDDWL
ncbi:MAG: hypothetical protein HQM14_13085 [SAR324 cluster bacterium]|nr:hypothetical protein [SAR324 cluster bacterium]